MGAYNRTNGEPCCGHSYLQDIIRDKWGFEGHIVSDCWAIRDFHENHKVTKTIEESAALALKKGCDLNCGCTYVYLMDAYNKGLVSEEDIRKAAVRLFTTRFMLGMFDETEYDNLTYLDVETKENLAVAKRASDESIVLLKNNGILPLDPDDKKVIAVIGPNADSRACLIGNYYGTSSEYITALEGIRNAAGDDIRILYSEGCDLCLTKPDNLSREYHRIAEAKAVMNRADLVVLVIGLNENLEGEEGDEGNQYKSGDKPDLLFPRTQRKLIDTVIASGKPFITVVMAGSAMDLSVLNDKSSAVLQAWYPGARGGADVADILFGDVSPSGKLPLTFYYSSDDLPGFKDYSMKNRTYRYFEGTPLYPFGYGLTYGDCYVKPENHLEMENGDTTDTLNAKLTVTVANDGKVDTDEVVQVYIKDIDSEFATTHPKLCGFKRVHIAAGSETEVTITLDKNAFTSVNEEGERKIFGKNFRIFAGCQQPDARSEELTGHKCMSFDVTL